VASPTKHKNVDGENKGPVEVVNVPAKDHAPILKPSVDNKDAPGLDFKNLILNFEHNITTGKDGQSQPSAGNDGKRVDNLPNIVQNKSDGSQNAQNAGQNDDKNLGKRMTEINRN